MNSIRRLFLSAVDPGAPPPPPQPPSGCQGEECVAHYDTVNCQVVMFTLRDQRYAGTGSEWAVFERIH